MIPGGAVTLGLLAGGRGERVGGRDKAWLPRGGKPALDTLLQELAGTGFAARLASVRSPDPRWAARDFACVQDLRPGQPGPLAGLEALAAACRTPWLLVLPVDVSGLPQNLFALLAAGSGPGGAWLRDGGGPQPLVGLWPAPRLHGNAVAALDAGETAVHRALAAMVPGTVDVSPLRLGNANTPDAYDESP
ncbi:MAG: molybdopterin-guanine dinucleotide biosynthesis protein MobA [Arenimonas sp.]|nr:molybdopterin-guanine dinucleotide biosynthesis protein MobA [Arenimonas sp.]